MKWKRVNVHERRDIEGKEEKIAYRCALRTCSRRLPGVVLLELRPVGSSGSLPASRERELDRYNNFGACHEYGDPPLKLVPRYSIGRGKKRRLVSHSIHMDSSWRMERESSEHDYGKITVPDLP